MTCPLGRCTMLASLALLTVAGCAARGPGPSARPTERATHEAKSTERPAPRPPEASRTHAVLTTGKRTFVLTGAGSAESGGERELIPGGFALSVQKSPDAGTHRFTLVGPEGRCSAESLHAVDIRVDYGGYAGAALPGPSHRGFEVSGCAELAHESAFLLAIEGDDPRASWIHPAHVDEVQAAADRKSGESEVWLHRWALPEADLEVVERDVLSFVTPSCSQERRDVLIVDELDRPVARHAGYYLRGAIHTSRGPLLVLLGHDEPEALRVVALGLADTTVALDTHLELFQDIERKEC